MDRCVLRRAGRRGRLILAAATSVAMPACLHQPPSDLRLAEASVISEAEIDSAHVFTAYDAVHKLRPEFLASRGKVNLNPADPPALPNVYVDNMFYGDVSTLRGITAGSIEYIRFYSSAEAQYKFGRGNAAGVIGITTKH